MGQPDTPLCTSVPFIPFVPFSLDKGYSLLPHPGDLLMGRMGQVVTGGLVKLEFLSH
jgi:hypothetical protein